MAVRLFDYQVDAVKRMKNGCILCGGVGSGKSRTALAYYCVHEGAELTVDGCGHMDEAPRDLYIITTARKRDTLEWDGELIPFHMSTEKERDIYDHKVVVDSWNNIRKYSDVKDAFFIFDEQRVVGNGTWVKAFQKIGKNNPWILLSATPGDTWMDYIPVFVANGFYKNRSAFIREHVVYACTTKFPKVDRYINTGRLIRLRDRILVNMDFIRDTVPHHEDVFADYDKLAYKRMMKERWDIWRDKPIENPAQYCYVLRKLVNSDESRQIAVLKILEEHPRAIIFYNYDYELDILLEICYGDDVEIAQWNGHKHQEIPQAEKFVYLVQYTAGCEGWNCVTTDTIIFYSQTYSYKVLAQACGRIDRLNTPYRDLYYYHLKSRSSIDLAISRAVSAKKQFNERRWSKW